MMDDHLSRVVSATDSWLECKERVIRSYGESMVPAAERIARTLRKQWFADEAPLEFRAESAAEGPEERTPERAAIHVRLPRLEVGRIEVEPLKVQVAANVSLAPKEHSARRGRWSTDRILLATAGALALAVLFPPFHGTVQGITMNLGYSFLFAPPSMGTVAGLVNVSLLACELLVISAIGALASLVGRFD